MADASAQGAGMDRFDWRAAVERLGPGIEDRAAAHDAEASFVSDNMELVRQAGMLTAAVPMELGGGGLDQRELGAMLRALARRCGSTALALSMHTHLVAALAWRWRKDGSTEPMLRRLVAERLALVSSGGSDWLDGSCRAEPVPGGYLISGRKIFASGAPGGDMLLTTAVLREGDESTVIHFPLALAGPGVTLVDSWDTLGMRGTGSLDLVLEDVFIPEERISVRRPAGRWHPAMHAVSKIAFPLIYSVYVGIAEAARDRAVELLAKRSLGPDAELLVGEMETELAAARLALADMLAASDEDEPGPAATSRVMIGRTLVGRAAIRTVEKAMEAAGGAGFYRKAGLERMFRDIQAARYHPLQEKPQARFAGRIALGLDPDGDG